MWREQIDQLKEGKFVEVMYTAQEQTLRKYISSHLQKINKAKYSVHKKQDNIYKICRIKNSTQQQ